MKPIEGRRRVIIEEIQPQVDSGRYPAKRILNDEVTVTAAVFADGHDHVAGRLLYRHSSERDWRTTPLTPLTNDLWEATFVVDQLGDWLFTIEAWVDHFATWCADLKKRLVATDEQNIPLALRTGAILLEQTAQRARGPAAHQLTQSARDLNHLAESNSPIQQFPLSCHTVELAGQYPDLSFASRYAEELHLWVDRERARYSTWYELFPRSTSPDPSAPGLSPMLRHSCPPLQRWGSMFSTCLPSTRSVTPFAKAATIR